LTMRNNMYAPTAVGVMDHDMACRVMISPTSNYVEVQCLKGLTLDDNIKRHYIALKDTPEWIQNRVNALSVLDPDEDHIVENVGVRSTHHTFWVYKND
jgi:hypothetical protein